MQEVDNVNVAEQQVLMTPAQLKREYPLPGSVRTGVSEARRTVADIVNGRDPRMLVVVGPCSIHDPTSALDYAQRLQHLSKQLEGELFCVMRSYFEKPRSTVGWKGLINDPHLDGTFCIEEGLQVARRLLLELAKLDVPVATEALDPISPQYLHDLVTWSAIGARTTESQTHREMASGLSCAVGFKNGTDGSLEVALNALQAAGQPHSFLGMNGAGQISIVQTTGNDAVHLVLRGGSDGPNYSPEHIAQAEQALRGISAQPSIMIDCSHANSNKDYRQQSKVLDSVCAMKRANNRSITGVMIESHINPGKQDIGPLDQLSYGVSITDACVGWEETERMLRELAKANCGSNALGPKVSRNGAAKPAESAASVAG